MEITKISSTALLVVIITLVFFLMAVAIILFIVQERRKSERKEREVELMQARHQKEMFKSVIETQEKERQRIAKNIHDEVNASITVASMSAGKISNLAQGEIQELAKSTKNSILSAEAEMRQIINDLSPVSLTRFGLHSEIKKLGKMAEAASNLDVEINSNLEGVRFDPQIEINLYRVIKEFVHNTLKYAEASKLCINALRSEGELYIILNDNGIGFDLDDNETHGHGLNNMKSRIYLLNGSISFVSDKGNGLEVNICIPLNEINRT
jgi:signal transduction histidine kinase